MQFHKIYIIFFSKAVMTKSGLHQKSKLSKSLGQTHLLLNNVNVNCFMRNPPNSPEGGKVEQTELVERPHSVSIPIPHNRKTMNDYLLKAYI